MEASRVAVAGEMMDSPGLRPGVTVDWVAGKEILARNGLPSPRPRDREGTAALEGLISEAMRPEGGFRYDGPVAPSEISLPSAREKTKLVDRSGLAIIAMGFAERAAEIGFGSAAIRLYKDVHEFMGHPPGSEVRPVLFEAPYAKWKQGSNVQKFMGMIRTLYGVVTQDNILRLDPEPTGTNVYLAFSGDHFLLVERSVLTRNETGEYVIMRRLEVADASDVTSILRIVNEPSLRELIRMKQLLYQWGVPQEKRAGILQRANRDSVRSDADLRTLVRGERVKRRRSWVVVASSIAEVAIGATLNKLRRRRPREGSHRRLSSDSTT